MKKAGQYLNVPDLSLVQFIWRGAEDGVSGAGRGGGGSTWVDVGGQTNTTRSDLEAGLRSVCRYFVSLSHPHPHPPKTATTTNKQTKKQKQSTQIFGRPK